MIVRSYLDKFWLNVPPIYMGRIYSVVPFSRLSMHVNAQVCKNEEHERMIHTGIM